MYHYITNKRDFVEKIIENCYLDHMTDIINQIMIFDYKKKIFFISFYQWFQLHYIFSRHLFQSFFVVLYKTFFDLFPK